MTTLTHRAAAADRRRRQRPRTLPLRHAPAARAGRRWLVAAVAAAAAGLLALTPRLGPRRLAIARGRCCYAVALPSWSRAGREPPRRQGPAGRPRWSGSPSWSRCVPLVSLLWTVISNGACGDRRASS